MGKIDIKLVDKSAMSAEVYLSILANCHVQIKEEEAKELVHTAFMDIMALNSEKREQKKLEFLTWSIGQLKQWNVTIYFDKLLKESIEKEI